MKAEIEALAEWIESCKDEHVEESDICIPARTKDARDETADVLKERGYDVVVLQPRKADRRKLGVRVVRIKMLDEVCSAAATAHEQPLLRARCRHMDKRLLAVDNRAPGSRVGRVLCPWSVGSKG